MEQYNFPSFETIDDVNTRCNVLENMTVAHLKDYVKKYKIKPLKNGYYNNSIPRTTKLALIDSIIIYEFRKGKKIILNHEKDKKCCFVTKEATTKSTRSKKCNKMIMYQWHLCKDHCILSQSESFLSIDRRRTSYITKSNNDIINFCYGCGLKFQANLDFIIGIEAENVTNLDINIKNFIGNLLFGSSMCIKPTHTKIHNFKQPSTYEENIYNENMSDRGVFGVNYEGISQLICFKCGDKPEPRLFYDVVYDYNNKTKIIKLFNLCEDCFFEVINLSHQLKHKIGYKLFEKLFLVRIVVVEYLVFDCSSLIMNYVLDNLRGT